MAFSLDETRIVNDLTNTLTGYSLQDERHDNYYEGQQRLQQIGLAVPPELRRFETVVNWPRLTTDSLNERLDVKSFFLPGEDISDPGLREGWDANDLDSESPKLHLDTFIYGRGYVCAGSNADDPDHPILTVESPREISIEVDPRTRRVVNALRLYGQVQRPGFSDITPTQATLYRPNVTIHLQLVEGIWIETDRDDHNIGRVPVIPFFNRLRTGHWDGVSEMADIIPLTDAAARSLTNLQVAGETHAVPGRWATGVTKGDFVDKAGAMLPVWEAYFTAMKATSNKDAKFGQFEGSSLSNFHETVNHYARLVGALSGLPPHFLGFSSENPASADAIRSSESRLVKRAELKQRQFGDSWGQVMAFYMRLRDDEWPDGRRIKVDWYDAATPTVAARTDAVVKLATGDRPLISREGAWDELGWSEARKERERAYFEAESEEGLIAKLLAPPPDQPDVAANAVVGS